MRFALRPLAALALLAAACGGSPPPPATDAHFHAIQRQEAVLDTRQGRALHGPCDEACPAAREGCAAAARICDIASSVDDTDARLRCEQAEERCRQYRSATERCECAP
ncbi:MAG TPA: hypothetical protein RMH85_13625 [Polyangiaceae bacterium LLY-WYZ-15_(1-7)]|nr:hypothetical protein [Sandaracinus sp.]HJL01929.1 hypothetical protein [Polyangiaceae bacterium LLY-WYZ-15_(1-7)]HJL09538.1 hypothetical protein [Polyangiaceae bacterium LLY-WYZ-15_(1-7)]HJL21619.1 hypothetical protein [Polyangiaceae bacterium LLY-WYZ-15_(1-7)]HJL32438.1 hypothetical protein [Polyangiaceae bacterium LLY-WYZ-15_(1-7)]